MAFFGFLLNGRSLCEQLIHGALIEVQALAAQHPGQRLLFLCRSGVRSVGAAQRATELGLEGCYNVLEGFEGDLDGAQQRGHRGGWRFRGLPWIQK